MLARTQKECKEKLAAALEQAGKVDAHKTGQFTVGQWAETWFVNYAKPSIRETTAAYYNNYINKHIIPPCDWRTKDAFAKMDIAGYNYGIYRYRHDLKKYPSRLILGSETFCSDAYRFRELAIVVAERRQAHG